MKTKESFLISLFLIFILVILQSTILHYLIPDVVIPDFALIVVAFCGARRGMGEGQLLGFFNGLAEDFLTAAFPGFHALIKTLIGFLSGTIKNKMLFDPVIFPSLFIFFVTLLKGILAVTTAYLFFPKGYFPAIQDFRSKHQHCQSSCRDPFLYTRPALRSSLHQAYSS